MLIRAVLDRCRRHLVTTRRTAPDTGRPGFAAAIDRATGRLVVTRLGAPLLAARDAGTFWRRLRGLHALPPLGERDALVLRPCDAVQTFRMAYPIDVVYLDRGGTVLEIVTLAPNRLSRRRGAAVVLELRAGTAARLALAPGQVLEAVTGERLSPPRAAPPSAPRR